MNLKHAKLFAVTFLLLSGLSLFLLGQGSANSVAGVGSTGLATVDTLESRYEQWRAGYVKSGGDQNVLLSIGWFKGLSTEETIAQGTVRLNLVEGKVSVDVGGLPVEDAYDFWMVDNGRNSSVIPDDGDALTMVTR